MKLSLKRGELTHLREILRRDFGNPELGNPSFESNEENDEEGVLVKDPSLAACIVKIINPYPCTN